MPDKQRFAKLNDFKDIKILIEITFHGFLHNYRVDLLLLNCLKTGRLQGIAVFEKSSGEGIIKRGIQ